MARFLHDKGAARDVGQCQFFLQGSDFRGDIKQMFLEADKHFSKFQVSADSDPVRIIFCIIEEKDSKTYHEIKRQGDLHFGFVTQCGE